MFDLGYMSSTSYLDEIRLSRPGDANISEADYVNGLTKLITKEIKKNPTVVLHTTDAMRAKYASSIIAVLNQRKIIGNASVYPTQMAPLNDIILQGRQIAVGELGSVIVHCEYRSQLLGEQLTEEVIKRFSSLYDIIVGATVNDRMFTLMGKHGFEQIPFPKDLYEEGKTHLAPKMKPGMFEEKAKCMLLNLKLSEAEKAELITTLDNEYH